MGVCPAAFSTHVFWIFFLRAEATSNSRKPKFFKIRFFPSAFRDDFLTPQSTIVVDRDGSIYPSTTIDSCVSFEPGWPASQEDRLLVLQHE